MNDPRRNRIGKLVGQLEAGFVTVGLLLAAEREEPESPGSMEAREHMAEARAHMVRASEALKRAACVDGRHGRAGKGRRA